LLLFDDYNFLLLRICGIEVVDYALWVELFVYFFYVFSLIEVILLDALGEIKGNDFLIAGLVYVIFK
jgi:hypothetical protein